LLRSGSAAYKVENKVGIRNLESSQDQPKFFNPSFPRINEQKIGERMAEMLFAKIATKKTLRS
jgi:hypothetical protein